MIKEALTSIFETVNNIRVNGKVVIGEQSILNLTSLKPKLKYCG